MGYELDKAKTQFPAWTRFISAPQYPDQLWVTPNLLLNGFQESVHQRQGSWDQKLTTQLHLEPQLRLSGVTLLLHMHGFRYRFTFNFKVFLLMLKPMKVTYGDPILHALHEQHDIHKNKSEK